MAKEEKEKPVDIPVEFDYEVTAPDEVQRDFMMVNDAKVREWIAAGGRGAPGLRVFQKG